MLWLLLFYPEVVDVVALAVLSRSSGCCGCCCCNTRDVANTPLLVLWDGKDVLTLATSLLTRQDCRLTVLEQRLFYWEQNITRGIRNSHLEQSFVTGIALQGTWYRKHLTVNWIMDSHIGNMIQWARVFSYKEHGSGNIAQLLGSGILIQETWIRDHRTFTWNRISHTAYMMHGKPNSHLEQI